MRYVELGIEKIIEAGVKGREGVLLEDYLKVVEEKYFLKENLTRVQNHLQFKSQECKEKDEKIEKLKEESEEYVKSQIKIKENYKNKIKDLKEKITCLEFGVEKEDEELWILEYIYEKEGVRKNVILDPQPLEEIHELVGMDCDNWISWSINRVKEVK